MASKNAQKFKPLSFSDIDNNKFNAKDEKEDQTFECNICLESPKGAVVTLCGHLYCGICLNQWLEKSKIRQECPVCKTTINKTKLVRLYGSPTTRQPEVKASPSPTAQKTVSTPGTSSTGTPINIPTAEVQPKPANQSTETTPQRISDRGSTGTNVNVPRAEVQAEPPNQRTEPNPTKRDQQQITLRSRQLNPCDDMFWQCRGYPRRPSDWKDRLEQMRYYDDDTEEEIEGEESDDYREDDEYDEEYDDEYDDEYDEEYDDEYDEEYDDEYDEECDDEYDEECDDEYDDEYDNENDDQHDDEHERHALHSNQNNPNNDQYWILRGYSGRPDNWKDLI